MTKAMLLGAGAALLLVGAAVAQDAKGPRGRMADTDGDGKISQTEMVQAERARFARLDANHDGKVTKDELEALETRFMDERFARLDTDKNGQISKEEFAAAHEQRAGRWAGRRGVGMGGDRMGGMLGRLDTNGDGVVTQAEADAKVQARFAAMDTNKDGFVTSDERPGKMGRHGRGPGGGEH
ncbi:EF-hand domain-containing protein [Caulobacter sp. 17J80-11]|uniref:EF-hand domain-containing protein n=1 Tax=Caulobacter sp. 17J80-11 TaxID=2763502 RepID=UPI00165364AC|nr:EF-hand domain-containing protein [Caulobacter sp. 17J80-11]MBC6980962.1 EF-hand domain-containing protein [Caulobacter sp. 17J80-11]